MLYYKSGLGDKISDYEDVWASDGTLLKPKVSNNLASPDLLQHTPGNVLSLNDNVLSPAESSHHGSAQRSVCNTPVPQPLAGNNRGISTSNIQSPLGDSVPAELGSPHTPKQQSPFYAEPADSLSSIQQAVAKRLVTRPAPGIPIHHRHSNPPGLNSMKALSPGLERVDDGIEFNGGKFLFLVILRQCRLCCDPAHA